MRFAIGAAVCEILATSAALAADPEPGGALEEVVVSAQFREEKLQTTPIAISAFTAENLESRGIVSVTDLDAFVPNAVIQPLGAGWGATMAAFIRGVGLGDNILSFEPGVPIYVDDVYIGRPQGAIFDLLDLERVEVLRGPQGTLFGKNAIGGTVRLISKKPTGDGSGSLSVAIGKYDRIDARGSTDVSLVDERVFARFSFSTKRADGYFNVLDYECVNGAGSLGNGGPGLADGTGIPSLGPGRLPDGSVPQNGYNNVGVFPNGGLPGIRLGSLTGNNGNCVVDTLGDENVQSGRAAFRFILNDKMEFNLIGDVTNQRQKGPADKYTIIDPTNGLNGFWSGAFAEPVFGPGMAWDTRFITPDLYSNYSRYDDPVTHRLVPNINNMNHWGVSGTYEWKLTDNLSLKSVTAYRAFWNKFGRDSDGTPLPLNATYDDSRHRQFTQEIQLTGTTGKLNWATGAFYYDAHDSNRGFDFLYPTIVYENDAFDRQDTTNWAVFAQGTYQFTDAFSFTLGGRYTDDQKDATIYRADFFGAVIIDNAFVPTKATNTDVTVSADYQWNDDLMTYLKYATGFKGGGFSPRPASALQTEPFKPEKLKTVEVGAKSELLERKVRLNGALFYSKYLDQQTFAQQNDAAGINWFREVNAGKARIWGLEGELQAEPVRGLRIDGSFGYINYNLTDNEGNLLLFEGDNCNGRRCYSPRTPKYNGAVGLQYSFGSTMGSITPRIDAQYQSTIYFTTNNQGVQEGYTLVNGRLTWESESNNWEVALYGANLTDKGYFNGKLNLVGFFGREQGNPGVPRTWGLSFKRNFTTR
jgi:iron complex outermembrane receptor protein